MKIRRIRKSEIRHLHFDLSHCAPGVVHTLHLGGKRHELLPHDDDSRAASRTEMQLLHHVPDERLTHHLPDIEVLADAVQSYWISHPSKVGELPNVSMLGIMIPKNVVRRAHKTMGLRHGLYSAKARRLGLVPPLSAGDSSSQLGAVAAPEPPDWINDGDLADFTDLNDAAVSAVYHHSDLITITGNSQDPSGSDTVVQIIGLIEHCNSFDNLVTALNQQNRAVDPDSDYDGWAEGTWWLDAAKQKIKNKATGQYQWWYQYTDQTNKAIAPVVKEAVRAVNAQANLDGISFKIDYGRQAVTGTSDTPQPMLTESRAVRGGAKRTRLSTTASGYTWELGDPDYHYGRQIVLGNIQGRTVEFTINNSYFRHLGVFVRFLDTSGNPIALSSIAPANQRPTPTGNDTKFDSFQTNVASRGRFMGVPTDDAESEKVTVTMPDQAGSMVVLAGGLGCGSIDSIYAGVEIPGAILTGVIDLGLPAFFLALGVAADMLESACKSAIADLVSWILETFITLIPAASMPEGQNGTLMTEWAGSVLQSIITEAPSAFLDLLECAGEVAGPEEALECVPIAGQILFALNTAASIADLTETTADVLLSPWVVTDELTSTLPLVVELSPDLQDYEFPASATNLNITAIIPGKIPYNYSAKLTDLFPTYPQVADKLISHTFTVPSGGTVQVDAFFTTDNGWVAATGSWSGNNVLAEDTDSLKAAITLTENPIPLNSSTRYQHKNVLQYDSATAPTRHVWKGTTTAPTATVADLGGNQAVELNGLTAITVNMTGRLGYAWAGTSPALLPPGQTSWPAAPQRLFTLQGINLEGDNPDTDLRILGSGSGQTGYDSPIYIVYDLLGPSGTGLHFVIAPVPDSAGVTSYHAFKISLDGTSPIDLSKLGSYGRFASETLDAVAMHPRGFLLGLNAEQEKVELLQLPSSPYASLLGAPYATQTGGQGAYVGRLHGSKAIAPTLDGNGFLVLEEVNNRIQVFSVNGTSIDGYFKGQENPWIPLKLPQDQGLDINWLSMALENTGYIYVLSTVNPGADPTKYRLDIYDPDGNFVSRTAGVAAAQIAVDKWRAVYTQNYELIVGPHKRPEPSVSLWVGVNG